MAQDKTRPIGPDLSQGILLDRLADGKMLVGHVGGDDVLLVIARALRTPRCKGWRRKTKRKL